MTSTRNLLSWVENGHAGQWFKWLEWVAITNALFVAAAYSRGWSATFVLMLAIASLIQCQMAAVAWLVNPLAKQATKRSRARFRRPILFASVLVGSTVALGCTLAAMNGLILSALARNLP